jgi:hypothetical protein
MPTAAPARTRRIPYVGTYENRELLKWLLNPDMLRCLIPWWDDFLKQQADIRMMYKVHAKSAQFTKTKNISTGGLFYHICRVPVNIAEIICACDHELDGRNEQKLELFLKDHPDFDLRVRGD